MAIRLGMALASSRAHLAEVSEDYWAHLRFACAVGLMLVAAGLACILHGIVPGLCRNTASRTVACLQRVIEDRSALGPALDDRIEAVAFALLVLMSAALGAALGVAGAGLGQTWLLTALALALPVTLLLVNPDLERQT